MVSPVAPGGTSIRNAADAVRSAFVVLVAMAAGTPEGQQNTRVRGVWNRDASRCRNRRRNRAIRNHSARKDAECYVICACGRVVGDNTLKAARLNRSIVRQNAIWRRAVDIRLAALSHEEVDITVATQVHSEARRAGGYNKAVSELTIEECIEENRRQDESDRRTRGQRRDGSWLWRHVTRFTA